MKKRYASLLAYSLMATLTLYNCKDHETPPPTPDFGKELEGIAVETVTLTAPAAVTSQAGTFAAPSNVTIITYTGGAASANMETTASTASTVLTTQEISNLNAITPAQIQAIASGGALPAEIQAVIDKIKANPTLAGLLPTFTLPTVNGVTVNARTGLPELLDQVEAIKADDACLKAAQDALAATIDRLKAAAKTQQDKVDAEYQSQVTAATTGEASCKTTTSATYTANRTALATQFNTLLSTIEANQSALGNFYGVIRALAMLQYTSALGVLNTLESAELKACTSKKDAAIANANAAKTENTNKVTAALNNGLKTANDKIKELTVPCHNQGGGR